MRYPHPLHIKETSLYGKRYSVGYMACQLYAALTLPVKYTFSPCPCRHGFFVFHREA